MRFAQPPSPSSFPDVTACNAGDAQPDSTRAQRNRSDARDRRRCRQGFAKTSGRGLSKGRFRLKVDGKAVAIESVEWIPAGRAEVSPESWPGPRVPARPPLGAAGRLIVFFVQSDIGRFRTLGHMRLLQELGPFIADLREDDRVAVVSFMSHLVLRLDFTNDKAAIRKALGRAIYHDDPPRPEQTFDGPSLLARLPADKAFNAYYVEDSLRLVAEALEPLAGAKSTACQYGEKPKANRARPSQARTKTSGLTRRPTSSRGWL
jgi:hypothetical protein